MDNRSWTLKKMRQKGQTEYTKSELALYDELSENCFADIPMEEINKIMVYQHIPKLISVEGIKVTRPPPRLDIAIPELKICYRVMGQVHESSINRRKDWLQKTLLEGNDWLVIDVWHWEREDLWK